VDRKLEQKANKRQVIRATPRPGRVVWDAQATTRFFVAQIGSEEIAVQFGVESAPILLSVHRHLATCRLAAGKISSQQTL
jgi:hypothetical protein